MADRVRRQAAAARLPPIELRDVEVFVHVARALSFAVAAQRIALPRSSVSRAVSRLERALGQRLLHRTSRVVTLTTEGRAFLARSGALLDELHALFRTTRAAHELAGALVVTAPTTTGTEAIGPAVAQFAARHPELKIDLRLTNDNLEVIAAGVDVAFRLGPLDDSSLGVRKLWHVDYRVAARDDVVRRLPDLRHPAELASRPTIVAPPEIAWRFRSDAGDEVRVVPDPRYRVDDLRAALDAAELGLGLCCAPRVLIERRALAQVTIPGWAPAGRDLFAVFPSVRLVTRRARALVDAVVAHHDAEPRP